MTEKTKRTRSIGILLKSIAILASIYGMIRSFSGFIFFTYFTNLSNIFVDVVLLYFLIQEVVAYKQDSPRKISNTAYRVKFMATISITLTFLVFLLILAPFASQGFIGAYLNNQCGSLCVHFINPILAITDFLLMDYDFEPARFDFFFGIVPPLCYVGFILIIGQLGCRWHNGMMAPYNFLNYGAPTGWFGFDLSRAGATTLGIGVFYMVILLILIFLGLGKLFLFSLKCRRRHFQ